MGSLHLVSQLFRPTEKMKLQNFIVFVSFALYAMFLLRKGQPVGDSGDEASTSGQAEQITCHNSTHLSNGIRHNMTDDECLIASLPNTDGMYTQAFRSARRRQGVRRRRVRNRVDREMIPLRLNCWPNGYFNQIP